MADHPIQGLMQTAMENIKEMVDVNTIVGDPVQTPDGSVIMPISKVGFGFVAGGSDIRFDHETEHHSKQHEGHSASVSLPFGGGSGGGVSITPIAFLVVGVHGVRIVPLDNQTHLMERVIDSAPKVFEKIQSMFQRDDLDIDRDRDRDRDSSLHIDRHDRTEGKYI
ncbi:GerW family sporulation protein [Paenibacillus sepulcri]|uniref:GerW family sporulation protein n=1 Tax=Paenibacillus sepulcri TaxID=359917 RepID=A0ABS7C6H8_9BACL|nr:GerW family sporulation protein [Paenibacillus sepulcri]